MYAALRIIRQLSAPLAATALACSGLAAFAQGAGTPPAPVAGPPPAAQSPAAPKPQDLLLACPTTRDYVGRVVAAIMVNGKGPYRFIIDTGANDSTVSPKLVAALGLATSPGRSLRVAGVTGTAILPSVPIESMQAGALFIAHTEVPVIWSPIMAGADGILGAAGLAEDSLQVDFRHNTVTIRTADAGAIPLGYARVQATRLRSGLLSVPGRVGDVPVDAIIDTGSPQTLGNMALYRALYVKPDTRDRARVFGVTKQVRPGNVQVAPTVDLGAIRIGNAVLVFGDFPIFKVWGLTAHPAIILGMDVLGTVDAFSIDFRHAQIGIAPRDYDLSERIPPSG
ncbi:MAG TPA: aspartyl protease family protein [Steroidobacteraceae bacterium]